MAAKISKYNSVPNSPIHQKVQVHENGVPNGNFRYIEYIITIRTIKLCPRFAF